MFESIVNYSWFVGALLILPNLVVYRWLCRRRFSNDPELGQRVFKCVGTLITMTAVAACLLGVLHARMGSPSILFPLGDSSSVVGWLSWVIALAPMTGTILYINTRNREVAIAISEIIFTPFLVGAAALKAVNGLSVLFAGLMLLR